MRKIWFTVTGFADTIGPDVLDCCVSLIVFECSEGIAIAVMTLGSILLRACLIWTSKKCQKCRKDDKTVVENIPLVESTAPNAIEILHTGDKVAIQDLIKAENSENTAVIR